MTDKDTRPFFYLSGNYFRLFTIQCLSNKAQRTHIELMCIYTNHDRKEVLTAEDLEPMHKGAIRELKKAGLLSENALKRGEYHLAQYVDDVEIFKRGPSPKTRQPIPASVRQEVYDRDGLACLHCGATEPLSLDHIYPWSLGGSDEPDNLQTLCRPCNSRKGAKLNHVVQGR